MSILESPPEIEANPREVAITVRLFGILGALARQRLVQFPLPRGSSVDDVIGALGKRFGGDFAARIQRVPGEMNSFCSLFVNGAQVDDLNMELATDGDAAEISVILFMASEGG